MKGQESSSVGQIGSSTSTKLFHSLGEHLLRIVPGAVIAEGCSQTVFLPGGA